MIGRRTGSSDIAVSAFARPLPAQSPPATKTARIGILTLRSPAVPSPLTEAIVQGLRELGYVDGRNLVNELPSTGYMAISVVSGVSPRINQ